MNTEQHFNSRTMDDAVVSYSVLLFSMQVLFFQAIIIIVPYHLL